MYSEEKAIHGYDGPMMAVNKYPETDRITLRQEIQSLKDETRRLHESLLDAHKRLAMHDERITSVERGIGE